MWLRAVWVSSCARLIVSTISCVTSCLSFSTSGSDISLILAKRASFSSFRESKTVWVALSFLRSVILKPLKFLLKYAERCL